MEAQATPGGQILAKGKPWPLDGPSWEEVEVGRRVPVHLGEMGWASVARAQPLCHDPWLPWACPARSCPFLRLPQALFCDPCQCPRTAPAGLQSHSSCPKPRTCPQPRACLHPLSTGSGRRGGQPPLTPRWVSHCVPWIRPQPSFLDHWRTYDSQEIPEASMQPTRSRVSLETLPVPGAARH